ncbi:MAG: alcohol dehydrogenase catalytic domain-containing protein [Rhizobiaceae bacterium]
MMLGIAKRSNEPVDMDLVERPEPKAEPGYVVLEVAAVGVCGTDVHIYKGEYKVVPTVTIGHEVCGVVSSVGQGVDESWIGRRVVSETFYATCGTCMYCRGGKPNMCGNRKSIGTHVNGAMAPRVAVPVKGIHEPPVNMSDAAASIAEPVACCVNSMFDDAPYIGAGDNVLVVGPGTIGIVAAQVARACGAKVTVRGTERDRLRLDLAKKLGFAISVAGDTSREESFDGVVECSGAGPGIADSLRHLRKGGHLMQMGIVGKDVTLPFDLICYRELRVTSGFASNPRSWRRAMAMLHAGQLDLEPLVSDVSPLKDWKASFEKSMAASGMKFVFDPRLG